METFIWRFHTQSTEYPEGFKATLGNSYEYAAEPRAPDARIFKLTFPTMKFFVVGGVIDATVRPEINMMALVNFYNTHRTWKSFTYPHPIFGNLVVKFDKPLVIPEGIPGGDGALRGFGLQLKEQP